MPLPTSPNVASQRRHANGQKPCLTVITPVFNEELNLRQYRESVERTLLGSDLLDVRVVLVDDGSRDGSWKIIQEICAQNPRFRGLRLSRNFGSHVAISAGFSHADGDAVATLACDLQDPPETILEFVEKWRANADVVWGYRRTREDEGWRVMFSNQFLMLLRRFAMPRHSKFTTGSFLLVDRKVVKAFRQFREHNRITFALVAWSGFDQDIVYYDRRRRIAGKSGWSFGAMIKTLYDAFLGFSRFPARMITGIGVMVFVFSVFFALYVLVSSLGGRVTPGWTSTMLIISTFFGVQFLLMGIVGEYLHRIYLEVTQRPLFFIANDTADTASQGSA
jgi:glycosyltransferase involved in cell wall biosynthesis